MPSPVYERRRPETTLYHVVQENLDTVYGAVEDGALVIALPKFVRKELEGYLACIHAPGAIRVALHALGLPTEPPTLARARDPTYDAA